MAVPMHSTTMQRRAPSAHATGDQQQLSTNGTTTDAPKMRKRRKTQRASAFRAYYGARSEAVVQMILLGGLLFILAAYTLYHVLSARTFSLKGWGETRYVPSTSMYRIGDKTMRYAKVRQEYDDNHPDDPVRTQVAVMDLHERTYAAMKNEVYDIYHCPEEPPPGYPYAWNILEVLEHWPPDDTTPRTELFQGLCVFDFHRDYDKAIKYRNAELPFVIKGDPSVHQTVERWNDPGYMEKLMGDIPHRTEYSPNNHFMYWVPPAKGTNKQNNAANKLRKGKVHMVEKPDNWKQPTELMRMKYADWLGHANVTDYKLGPDQPHWYYRLIGCGDMSQGNCDTDSSEYLFDELPWFQPKESLYIVEPERQRGIHCRFGMKGVIAENHFDGSRNFIALLGGERRYILSHPNQCKKLALYPIEHPSARHSAIDWSEPDLERFPEFADAHANEVVMQAGDVMVSRPARTLEQCRLPLRLLFGLLSFVSPTLPSHLLFQSFFSIYRQIGSITSLVSL